MRNDPLLEEQKRVSSKGLEYSFVGLSSRVIDIIDVCINLVWVMANYDKAVKAKDIIKNVQNVFINEEVKIQDIFWKEHCAGSLRELVDSHFEPNCSRFLKNIPERRNSEEERKIWENISYLKKFLNDFAHFKNTATDLARKILEDKNLIVIDDVNFDKLCFKFIMELKNFFEYKKR